jgi:hypothetical protein
VQAVQGPGEAVEQPKDTTGTRLLDSAAEKAETGGRYVGDLVKLQGASGKAEVAAGKAGAKGCEAAER